MRSTPRTARDGGTSLGKNRRETNIGNRARNHPKWGRRRYFPYPLRNTATGKARELAPPGLAFIDAGRNPWLDAGPAHIRVLSGMTAFLSSLDLDGRAGSFEILLHLRRVVLRYGFFDRTGGFD